MAAVDDILLRMNKRFHNLNKFIFILSILFGISSWVVFAGIWVESPLLIKALPEGWALPSMIGAVAQLGQIGPILLYILKCEMFACCPGRFLQIRNKRVPDRVIIYTLFIIGLISLGSIALFWQKTVLFAGSNRSLPFFIGVFFLAILDCSCTIVFLTYIGKFRQNYVTALYIGEGISSLLPSLFALAQGTGGELKCLHEYNSINDTELTYSSTSRSSVNFTSHHYHHHLHEEDINMKPNFSVSVYFWLLFIVLLISFFSFATMDLIPYFRKFRGPLIRTTSSLKREEENVEQNLTEKLTAESIVDSRKRSSLSCARFVRIYKNKSNGHSKRDKFLLLIAITLVSFLLYGFIPGLSSYSTLPYGPKTMHLSITLALITQPISSLIATFAQLKTIKQIYGLLAICFLITFYICLMALLSPCPLLTHHWSGGVIMILAWILAYAFLMYLRCVITSMLKKKYGGKSLMVCGLLTQVGQFMGSILIYLLVDFTNVFQEAEPCITYNC